MNKELFSAITTHIQLLVDVHPSSLLDLRDNLRLLADKANDAYMNTPQTETFVCHGDYDMSSCGKKFSFQTTPAEDLQPVNCAVCWEKDHPGRLSGLRGRGYKREE
jgi:hypothetical protein